MKNKINILNNNIVELFNNEYLGAYYGDILVDYYTTNIFHTPIKDNINKILIALKDTDYDFSGYNRMALSDEIILNNPDLELNDNIVPILRVSNMDNCEKVLALKEKYNDVHVLVDKYISWNLLEYLLRDKSEYIRLIISEESLKYMNFTVDNTVKDIYKLPETVLPTSKLELEIIAPTIKIGVENELDLLLDKYLPKKDKEEKEITTENKWSQVLKVLKEFTPNVIHTREDELINTFNTQDNFNYNKPLILYNSTNKEIGYYIKSMYILDTFRQYKENFREVNYERKQIRKS